MEAEKSRNFKKYIITVLVLIMFFVILFGIFKQYMILQDIRTEITAERNRIIEANRTVEALKNLHDRGDYLQRQVSLLEDALPDKPNEQLLIYAIEEAARYPGSTILEIHFDSLVAQDGYMEMPVKVVFEGRYQGLVRLLQNIGKSTRIMRVDDLIISAGRDGLPQIRADIALSTFLINET